MQQSVVLKSLLNEEFRIDSEYYTPDNLVRDEAVKKSQYKLLGDICTITSGPFGSSVTTERYDPESGCRYIRGKDIQSFFVESNDNVFVDKNLFNELSQFHLKAEDILITVVGMKFAKTAIVYSEDCPAIFSCKSTLLRNSKVNIYYLVTYLSSNVGYGLLRRGQRGAAQPGINLFDIKNVPVPIFSIDFQSEIASLVCRARLCIVESSDVYQKAQELLLSELGLSNWQPKHTLTFARNYSDTEENGRIDAEYFQPKYEEIVKAIKGYSGVWDMLGNLVKLKDKNFTPVDKAVYKYIELSNIAGNGEITDCMVGVGQDLPSRARRKVATGDVIVSSIEGSLSSIALVEEEYDQALCSTGFHVINSKYFNSETLLVLLKSMVGQLQLKKGCSGTILTAINQDEFTRVVLPKVNKTVQSQIKQKIIESFNLRKQSKHLLKCAKRTVEIAIEQDEDAAIKWLQDQT